MAGGCGSGSSSPDEGGAGTGRSSPSIAQEEASAGDQSIQHYGAEAAGGDRKAVVGAMHAYFLALAASDYEAICAGLTASNREQLQQLSKLKHEGSKGCAGSLATVLPGGAPEAKKAAAATISRVRIGDGNAFVLFRPAGGTLSYFVMKEEDGEWKATSVAAGAPLSP